jgi:hypothetical protein
VTKIYYHKLLHASEGTLSCWSRLHLRSLAPTPVSRNVDVRQVASRKNNCQISITTLSVQHKQHVVPISLSGIRVGKKRKDIRYPLYKHCLVCVMALSRDTYLFIRHDMSRLRYILMKSQAICEGCEAVDRKFTPIVMEDECYRRKNYGLISCELWV